MHLANHLFSYPNSPTGQMIELRAGIVLVFRIVPATAGYDHSSEWLMQATPDSRENVAARHLTRCGSSALLNKFG
ncbi:hypothetical protein [Paraburkholderia acidisoli]|uniref:Uncharacterized protein n=1 Tax=Paraburkholderia acidisoli TaxID=2571748 RepID=A0A7Z2JGW8_9BURK|nr:hypothetical protein [Paraburkholderia acidisoli]QGZ64191.1 hypothetical protein FAZ98_20915 [Paraburkholderia acidisoli]